MGIFTPEYFQAKPRRKNYFEGWYFKLRAQDFCFAVIAGITFNLEDPHAFIQTLDSSGRAAYYRYPLSEFFASRKKLHIKIGGNIFSDNGVTLDLEGAKGAVNFSEVIYYPRSIISPNIMGPFAFLPLGCNHAVVHGSSKLSGALALGGETVIFDGGAGYCEKDYGKSFPKSWCWLHADDFSQDISIMVSAADVSVLGVPIKGIIAFVRLGKKLYNISTYNGAKIVLDELPGRLIIKNRFYRLDILLHAGTGCILKAPGIRAKMDREITETLSAEAGIQFFRKEKILFSGVSKLTAVETVDSDR